MATLLAPPSYSLSLPPSYTPNASSEEISLDRSERTNSRHDPATHTLVRTYCKRIFIFTAYFLRQRASAGKTPAYKQGETVDGYLFFNNRNGYQITDVLLEVDGRLLLQSDVFRRSEQKLLHLTQCLWKQEDDADDSIVAPDRLDFSLALPRNFVDEDGEEKPLPSSIASLAVNNLKITVEYTAKITVCLKGYGGFVKKRRTLSTTIKYVHKSQPASPPLSTDQSFLSTVKITPESWCDLSLDLPLHRMDEEVLCAVAVPASRVFCVLEPIPVHVQISGPELALRQFLSSSAGLLPASEASSSEAKGSTSGVQIDVYLRRTFVAVVDGHKVAIAQRLSSPAKLELGYGNLSPLNLLAWNGTLEPNVPDSWAPSCQLERFRTVDSIVIDVRASSQDNMEMSKGTVLPRIMPFTIKLVTDPCAFL